MKKLTTSQTPDRPGCFVQSCSCSATMSLAQISYMENEVAHQVSNKAEQGPLGWCKYGCRQKEITLSFVTVTKAKKIKVENMFFDYDLNFKTSEKGRVWARERQRSLSTSGSSSAMKEVEKNHRVTAEPTMMGNLVFKRKEITSFWSWYYGGYRTSKSYRQTASAQKRWRKQVLLSRALRQWRNRWVIGTVSRKSTERYV